MINFSKLNIRQTKQRTSLANILEKQEVITAKDLYQKMTQKYPSISLDTIYKNLYLLQNKGAVGVIVIDNKNYYYLEDNCQHRSYCIKCQKVFKLEFCPLSGLSDKIKGEIIHHQFFVIIKCFNC